MTDTDDDVPPSFYAMVVLGSASYVCLLFTWFLLPAYLPPIRAEFGLTSTQAGILTGAIPLTYVPLSLFSGLVVDRIGPHRGMAVALVLIGGAQAVRGFASGFPSILAATVLLGIGGTGITFGLPKLVSGLFPPRLLGSMSTVYMLGSFAGTAAAFSVGRGVLGPLLGGWRPVFTWSGVAVLGFALVWTVAAGWHARRYPRRYESDRDAKFTPGSIRSDVARVFGNRGMRLLAVVGVTYLLLTHGLQGWLQTLLEHRGFAADVAATIATAFVVSEVVGTLLIPPASDRFETRRGAVALCGALAAVGCAGLLVAGSAPAVVLTAGVAGIGVGGVSPLVRTIPTELDGIGPELTATAVGLVFAVGEIGGFAGPFVVGALRDATGSFAAGVVFLGLGGVVMLVAGRMLPEASSSTGASAEANASD
jgi:cyanate permease